jgi:hypothetical protein
MAQSSLRWPLPQTNKCILLARRYPLGWLEALAQRRGPHTHDVWGASRIEDIILEPRIREGAHG